MKTGTTLYYYGEAADQITQLVELFEEMEENFKKE
jgi:hypothetical protein